MKLWAWILIFGAAGCGWLFLKARQTEVAATYKKIGRRGKSIRKAAERLAAEPSGIEVVEPPTSKARVSMSRSLADAVAKDLVEPHQ